ncbi:MAG: type III pantothenate kinase [Planctomycetota bacterium]
MKTVVDVGNSAIKCVAVETRQSTRCTFPLDNPNAIEAAGEHLSSLMKDHESSVHVASVNRSASRELMQFIDRYGGDASIVNQVTFADFPRLIRTNSPEQTGVDRLMGAHAAYEASSKQANHQRGIVVVDAGSAVTIDLVDAKGAFCGGVILPGIELQSRSLAEGTEALPTISFDDPSVSVPAIDTVPAITAGILTSIAAAVDRLAWQYRVDTIEVPLPIILGGGDAKRLASWIESPLTIIEDLVCQGILSLVSESSLSRLP